MSKISIHDTHRLPYNNATITARSSTNGSTTPVMFKNSSGEDLGYTIYTNARGYLCDSSGALYTSGVFVPNDSIITATLGDGSSTNWTVVGESDVAINDGKLIGKVAGGTDENKMVIFTANQAANTELRYDNLLGLPDINQWMEVESVVKMTQHEDTYKVNEFTKTVTVVTEISNLTSSQTGSQTWRLTIQPADNRVAQAVVVKNMTPYRLNLCNTDGSVICTVNAYTGHDDNAELIAYFGSTDQKFIRVSKGESFSSGDRGEILIDSQDLYGQPIIIDDRTPPLLHIVIDPSNFSWQMSDKEIGVFPMLHIKNNCTHRRLIRIWVNCYEGGDVTLVFEGDSHEPMSAKTKSATIATWLLFSQIDRTANPVGVSAMPIANFEQTNIHTYTFTSNTTVSEPMADVPPGTDVVVATVLRTVHLNFDGRDSRNILVVVNNAGDKEIQVVFRAPHSNIASQVVYTAVAPGASESIWLMKVGALIKILGTGNSYSAAGEEIGPISGQSDGNYWWSYRYANVRDGDRLSFYPWNDMHRVGAVWGHSNGHGNDAILLIPNFSGTKTFTLHIGWYMSHSGLTDLNLYFGVMKSDGSTFTSTYSIGNACIEKMTAEGEGRYVVQEIFVRFVITKSGYDGEPSFSVARV